MDASRWAVLAQPGCCNEGEYQVNYRHTLSLQNLALPHVLTLNQLVQREVRQGDSGGRSGRKEFISGEVGSPQNKMDWCPFASLDNIQGVEKKTEFY